MKWTVGGLVIVKSVLPAPWILARLVLTAADVLSEVDLFHRRNIETHALSEVFERDSTILITVHPIVDFSNLTVICNEAPLVHQPLELVIIEVVAAWKLPLDESLLESHVGAECSCDKALFQVTLGDDL